PSSQASAPSGLRSPHTVSVHTLGLPSHLWPSSTRQTLEQPSPDAVLPSSHGSAGAFTPSPQSAIGRQGCPAVGQLKPFSVARQLLEQPSSEFLLPSSQ